MSDKDNGGPAFPTEHVELRCDPTDPNGEAVRFRSVVPGMSLRDYFAGEALNGMMTREGWIGYIREKKHRAHVLSSYALDAYALADAMLAERAK